jgi:hypothetical protein
VNEHATPPSPDALVTLAVGRVYRAFAGHRLGSSMTVRRPDVTAEDVLALAVPLPEVAGAAIDRWLPHAATTWGTTEDLKALLPRVVELFAAGRLSATPEVLFGKLRQLGVEDWPVEERAALDDLVGALWLATLARHPAPVGYPAWRLLASLAELGAPLTPFLDDWHLLLGQPGPLGASARRHLEDLAQRAARVRRQSGDLDGLFWSPHPTEAARLGRWLAERQAPAGDAG